jgi:Domain of unknown function (DUF4268)
MTTPNLGRLTTVPPRNVWTHEAHHFTPWLLQNVDVLSDLLGMDLELEVAEHPVGGFSLDLLGRDRSDDSIVIVENQLEQSDHTHLGQILTYAAGTNPKTIVWITTGFRPEHRAALDWLNEHTGPDTRFFGVEIEVVRIGDSDPAPNFRLVAEPNDWEKQVKAATAAGAMTEKSKLYWDFWEQFRSRVIAEHPGWTNRKTSTRDSWYSLPTGTSVASLESTFTQKGLAVQLYFGGADPTVNTARFEALQAKQDQFEQALGEDAAWDEMTGRKAARVCVTSEFTDVATADQWPAMVDWLLDQHARFRRAVQAVGGLGSLT